MALTEAALLHEVARLQRDKTLLAVRDLIDKTTITKPSSRSYSSEDRTAREFRADLLAGLRTLGDDDA